MSVPNFEDPYTKDGSDQSTPGYKGSITGMPDDGYDAAREAGSTPKESLGDDQLRYDEMLRMAQQSAAQATTYMLTTVRPGWARSYRAFRNHHWEKSKYSSEEYRGRSKLFRPKTRSAVRKAEAQAADALFGTGDVVSIKPQNTGDRFQEASAAIKQELLNYRLSRGTRRNGVRWFQIAMGAIENAKITSIVASKQSWLFQEEETGEFEAKMVTDPDTGEVTLQKVPKMRIIMDRPDIFLFPSENVLIDPNCDWTNPAQTSQYVQLRYPMAPDDALTMIENNVGSANIPWFPITREQLMGYVDDTGPMDAIATRVAREHSRDPLTFASGTFGRLWLIEVFMRVRGKDMVFWTINNQRLLSKPVTVREAYPEQDGERPIVIGTGAMEAHRPFSMSPVESWQQMQMEINDQVNLRLDHMKQVVSPPALVVRGKKVDLTQVQRRGPNGLILVQDIEDVVFQQIPDVPQSAFIENQALNQDFDDLAGAFNPVGTEQSNAGASETFGGLSLIANAASTMGKFDLTVITETWIEPVISQILRLEEMYESDEKLLTIAGEKAKLFERFGVSDITDEMLRAETTLSVKIGVGAAAQPAERVQKFAMAMQTLAGILGPMIEAKVIECPKPNIKEIIDTVLGGADFKDGGDRFFIGLDEMQAPGQPAAPATPPPPDPKMAAVQVAQQKNQQDGQLKAADIALRQKELAVKHIDNMAKNQLAQQSQTSQIAQTHMKTLAEIGHAMIQANSAERAKASDQGHDHSKALFQNFHELLTSKINNDTKMAMQSADHAHQDASQASAQEAAAQQQDAAQQAAAEQQASAQQQQASGSE